MKLKMEKNKNCCETLILSSNKCNAYAYNGLICFKLIFCTDLFHDIGDSSNLDCFALD